jgi:exonuclease III
MDMRFGTWNVRSMYRAVALRSIAEKISKNNLDLVGVQEVRWDGDGTESEGEYTFLYGKGNENHELGTVFSYIRELCQQLRGRRSLVIGCHT